jgi:hypothetical protein
MSDTKTEPQNTFYDSPETASDADARELAALGKKAVLRVSWHVTQDVDHH